MAAASETTPLFNEEGLHVQKSIERRDSVAGYASIAESVTPFKENPDLETTWKAETKILLRYSAPLILTYLLQYSYQLIAILVAGRLGTNELGASSLASTTGSITGIFIYEGLATSLDTLTSQAYGAGRKHLVGLYVQRMIALVLVATIPIGVLWFCSPWILASIIPEKEIAHMAGSFMRVFLLGAPGYGIFEAGKRFTQAQGHFLPSFIVLLICAPLNLLWNYLFVFRMGLGLEGTALAIAVSNNLQPLVLLLYIYFFVPETHECWPGVSIRGAFQNWGPMLKLSLACAIMNLAEWLAFDILAFMASYLSASHLAAQSVLMAICVTFYHNLPFPISIAASTRFGNLIGYGALRAARTSFNTYYKIFICIGVFDITLLISLRHVIGQVFSDDQQVQAIVAAAIPVVATVQFFDALTAITNGLLRGLGRQKIGSYVGLAVFYLMSIPLSTFLTFGPPRLELSGLWIGPGLGLCCVTLILGPYMHWADWQKAHQESVERGD